MKLRTNYRLFFILKSKIKSIRETILYKNISTKNKHFNLFFYITNYILRDNLKLKFNILFLKLFTYLLNFISKNWNEVSNGSDIQTKSKPNIDSVYSYLFFLKKNFISNKWFFNLNSLLVWLLSNYELLFFFKKNNSIATKIKFSFYFLLKKKRKKVLFKWIKNQLDFILKKNFFFKLLNLFLELILNYKKSNFFRFKSLIYKTIIIK